MGCGCNNNENVRRKRIGNDLRFNLTILDGESPYDLEGKDLTLAVRSPFGVMPYGDLQVSGNVISFTLYGKDQKVNGLYTAILQENAGEIGMKTVDITDIVMLVPHTRDEGGEDRCSHLSVETIDLTSQMTAGIPGPKGDTGNGIESVEQIQTSLEDSGENIVRVTMTDGTTSDFSVRNGSKGSKGETGSQGEKGDTPVLTADEDGTIYTDGVLLTEVVKDVTEAVESAERSRESQAASDHDTAVTDHTIASSDHSTAVADHEASTSATEDANDAADAANDAAASVQHIVETRIGSETIHNIVELTQAEYDALQTKRDDTMYIITDTEIPSSDVGIASFEQTTESTEDGGTNIWTVTLTNGQTFQFAVKNGKQGNSGYSGAAGELEVVDNLSDGGATAALSAEQGKTLNIHDYVTVDVDPDAWPVRDYYLNISTGKWGTSTDYKHQEIPVHGCSKVIVKAAERNATIAWLATSGSAASGATADLTPGSTGTVVPAGTTVEVTAPAEAHYLYVYLGTLSGDEYTYAPESVTVMYAKVGNDYTIGEDRQGLSRGDLIPLVDLIAKGENIDLTSLTRYVGYIGSNGNSAGSGNGDRFYIPVKEGQHLIIKSAGKIGSQFAWVSQIRAENTNNGQSLYMLSGTQRMSTSPDVIWTGTVPAGAVALLVNTGLASNWYGREGMTPKAVYLYDSPSFSDGTGINEVNPESEFRPKMMSARKRYYTSTTNDKQPPLVIAHLSDIHANWPNVSRFLEFAKKYSTFIDELLNTGDTVSDHLSQGIAGYAAIDGAEDILNIIGNHDTRGDGGGNNWRDNIGLPAYNAIIAPFVANWGVTQPEGAAENGYCYFYKDYTAKSIRLVCVDIMAYDATEDAWLAGVLADALTNGLHVVIATHFAGSTSDNTKPAFEKIPCNYTSLYAVGSTSDQLDVYNPYAYHMMATVDSYMQGGGKFVGYLQGHYHTDVIARVAAYPSQMIYSIGPSKAGEVRDYTHTVGTRNQDEFQIVAIDTVSTIVKLFKVGANIDRYGRTKGSVCVDYTTGEILGEGYF